jgi:predicted ATPase with chaperone activity
VVRVEVDLTKGITRFAPGLPTSVHGGQVRVRSADEQRLRFSPMRVTVNLAPADVRKREPAYDLAVALA